MPANAPSPKVFLDYDQAALDAAYDQNVYAPNREQIHSRNLANSNAVVARLGAPERFAYGPGTLHHLDVFRTQRADAPIFIFVHGGAWRTTGHERYFFIAEPFVRAGAHVVVLQFDGIEGTNGHLIPMAEQIRRGVAWVWANAARIGGDPHRIFVGGHSSGAHMTGTLTYVDWERYGASQDLIKGALCCSGMYELAPVSLSKRSAYVTFDAQTLDELSTMRHLTEIGMPLVVLYGTAETPEFQRQNRDFAAAASAAGKSVRLLVGEGYNHFEIIETLGNPYGLVGHAALTMMGLEAQ
jgi:arylformamidase